MAKVSKSVAALSAFPFGSAGQLARAVRTGKVSAVELLRAYLDRIDRLNPNINAIVVDDRERALKDARAADRLLAKGGKVGRLHGVPMTVKESFNIPGQPTTFGNPAFAANMASIDAVVVERLRAAGAVVSGKTNVTIALSDFQSYNAVYGTTNNPWDVSRGAGGSSGGSAATIAAGPDLEDGYRLALPAPPRELKGLRVAVWLDEPDIAPVDDRVKERIEDAARALERA